MEAIKAFYHNKTVDTVMGFVFFAAIVAFVVCIVAAYYYRKFSVDINDNSNQSSRRFFGLAG